MNARAPAIRVLAIHRYFWPDTAPYASLLRALAAHWVDSGALVEIFAAQPSYKPGVQLGAPGLGNNVDGISVRRASIGADGFGLRRIVRMVWFSLLAAWRVLRARHVDVVMCSTVPQVLLGWFVSLAARLRGARFVYHCMDLHPEIGAISGEFAHPVLYRLLMWLDLATCRRAAAIVVLSDDMRRALVLRDPRLAEKIKIINNFDLPDFADRAAPSVEPPRSERLRILFAGNLGRFQNLETIVAAILADDPRLDRLELVLMGDGDAKEALVSLQQSVPHDRRDRVVFWEHGSISDARSAMRGSDLGLVSLVPKVVAFAYPSKVATYLSEGLPILLGVEDSSLARSLTERGVGTRIDLTTVESARRDLAGLVGMQDELGAMRDRALATWREQFSPGPLLEEWDDLLADVAQGSPLRGTAS